MQYQEVRTEKMNSQSPKRQTPTSKFIKLTATLKIEYLENWSKEDHIGQDTKRDLNMHYKGAVVVIENFI